ncbi:30S ribosome-binding factor RbfA [Kangiella profundi]|uniref:Ribosome-binding factor A n=2 Tax=Kangiella TaxID=261963 RepID=A0A2K9AJY6_9GAMM|nr:MULTISPECIES: 30S ribosome-binding factor RbfA [Kangiella]AUD77942.1 30S ribosome-binding factor RbfA [Kangiella profundi]WQG85385.1 30S ribosome-binding factor RbfA [Kangiella aquimarina]GGE91260.1 ribosome-binding factor A [Kangiella profundi]
MSQARAQRVADQIQRELAVLLQREVKDPRLGIVTVSAVEVTSDLQNAKVFVTFLGKDDEQEIKQALEVLSGAAGFLRSQLAKSIRMRSVPSLRFLFDKSIVEGQRMSSLIEKAISEDESKKS